MTDKAVATAIRAERAGETIFDHSFESSAPAPTIRIRKGARKFRGGPNTLRGSRDTLR